MVLDGNAVRFDVESFDPGNVNVPYYDAQKGSREAR